MDYGIKISDTETDVNKAELDQLLLSSRYPFAKLDTSNEVSFRNIQLRMNQDTPNPAGTSPNTVTDTVVYQFAHGYDYTPAYWSLIQVLAPPTSVVFYQDIFQDDGVIGQTSPFSVSSLSVQVDEDNVYVIVSKYLDTGLGGSAMSLIGTVLRIRLFVFVENID
jgi:hypothetical protein